MKLSTQVYWYAKKKKLEKCGEAMMTLVLNEFLEFLVMRVMVMMIMEIVPVHYRLRCPLGRFLSQKNVQI